MSQALITWDHTQRATQEGLCERHKRDAHIMKPFKPHMHPHILEQKLKSWTKTKKLNWLFEKCLACIFKYNIMSN